MSNTSKPQCDTTGHGSPVVQVVVTVLALVGALLSAGLSLTGIIPPWWMLTGPAMLLILVGAMFADERASRDSRESSSQ